MKTLRASVLIASAAGVFCLVAGVTSAQAPQKASLKLSETANVLNIASRDNHCPVETHPRAINPEVVECHAKFAPVPVIPPFRDQTTQEQRLEYGRWLVAQLDQPGVCGEGTKVNVYEACAILIYVLDPRRRQVGSPRSENYDGPWTYVVKIYRVTHPKAAGDASVEFVFANDTHGEYGSDEVWNLLAEQRAAERCSRVKSQAYVRDNGLPKMPDSCRRTDGADVRFFPALILPRSEAERVLNADAIKWHFRSPDLGGGSP